MLNVSAIQHTLLSTKKNQYMVTSSIQIHEKPRVKWGKKLLLHTLHEELGIELGLFRASPSSTSSLLL
jgi:hypothetical protein